MAAILPSALNCCVTQFCSAPTVVAVPGPKGDTGPVGPASSGETAGWFDRETLDAARLIPASSINVFLVMQGSTTPNDGFGGLFNWSNTSVALDNYSAGGGSVICPLGWGGQGRWLRFI